MTDNYSIAQQISEAIGTMPIPFQSLRTVALEIYSSLGGEPSEFDSIYQILLETLTLSNIGYTYNDTLKSFTAGTLAISSGYGSFATNNENTASGTNAFAEGYKTTASGNQSHSEGNQTVASASQSHAEGWGCQAINNGAHAEGDETVAQGKYSHAEGESTIAQNDFEHSEGHFNNSHKYLNTYGHQGNTAHSVGIGSNNINRKNAFEIMQNGDIYMYGIGGYDGTNIKIQDNTIKTLQEYILSLEQRIAALGG